jgi:L,D-transpeptidase YcbB
MMQAMVCSRICLLSMVVFAWLCAHAVAIPQHVGPQLLSASMPEALRGRIETIGRSPSMTVQNETLGALASLVGFYERRGFRPVWLYDEGLRPHADALVQVISQAEREGIQPTGYHLSRIEQLMAEFRQRDSHDLPQRLRAWVDLELLLTDAFFMYGSHVLTGQIDPRDLQEVWFADRPPADLETVLQQASEADLVAQLRRNLRPPYAGYAGLQKALVAYRDLLARGGWPVIPEGAKLQSGDRGPGVVALRHRLRLTSDLDEASTPVDDLFDAALERGVQRFQERHGLDADGVVGPATLMALNVPAEVRVRQIELNMERWRWLPQTLGDRYVLVNIANFALDVVEHGQSVLAMRAVVGKPARRTPFFSADMTYLVLSPHWYVPPTIAIQDKLPLIRRNPAYVARQHFKLFRHGAGGMARVDPMAVDWSSVSARNFPYQLRQEPGPQNALGRVKFMLPNPYDVYLHDTPSRELFAKTERAFSSGCIRLEKPLELAQYLLRADPRWSQQKILASIKRGTEQVVQLPTSIPVHLLYWTAWVNEDGVVHFRKDIYERDKVLDEALQKSFSSRKDKEDKEKIEVVLKDQR